MQTKPKPKPSASMNNRVYISFHIHVSSLCRTHFLQVELLGHRYVPLLSDGSRSWSCVAFVPVIHLPPCLHPPSAWPGHCVTQPRGLCQVMGKTIPVFKCQVSFVLWATHRPETYKWTIIFWDGFLRQRFIHLTLRSTERTNSFQQPVSSSLALFVRLSFRAWWWSPKAPPLRTWRQSTCRQVRWLQGFWTNRSSTGALASFSSPSFSSPPAHHRGPHLWQASPLGLLAPPLPSPADAASSPRVGQQHGLGEHRFCPHRGERIRSGRLAVIFPS